jgi:hypothetical protein
MHPMLIGKGSAKAAWEAIKVQHQGNHYKKFATLRPPILVTEWSWVFIRDLSMTKNSWSTAERH